MTDTTPRPHARHRPLSRRHWLWVIFGLAILQHIQIIEGIPLTVLVFPVFCVVALRSGYFGMDRRLLAAYIALALVATASWVVNRGDPQVSSTSFVYLIYLMLPFALRARPPADWWFASSVNFWAAYRVFMIVAACLGLCQTALGDSAWSLHDLIPDKVVMAGYNTTNTVNGVTRTNGFFFYEPSFFSQFLAFAILAEMRLRRKALVIGLYVAALLATLSGTGMLLLLVGVVLQAAASARLRSVVALLAPLLILAIVGVFVAPDLFFDRITEFDQENSSAYMRFIAPALYIYEAYQKTMGLLLGVGPGMAASVREAELMADFPGIGKVMFEYGLLGTIAVGASYWMFARRSCSTLWLVVSLFVFQFFLSSGLLQPATIIFFILFVLFGGPALQARHPRKARPAVAPPQATTT